MGVTQVNGVTINKLTLSKYRELKNSNSLSKNESYVITDIDEQLPIYKASEDASNPIILRNLNTGIYKIYGYFKYYSSQSGISGVDPFAYVIVEKGTSYSYVTIISSNSSKRYKITNSSYEDLDDSGWKNATLTSNFNAYSNISSNTPQYRKVGNIVEIRGVVSPKSNLTGSTTGVTIFTLPTGYRPSNAIFEICQGSGKNVWLLTINSNGTVQFSRYGTNANATASTSAWLCFNKTFTI
jgi:hypothetical protein